MFCNVSICNLGINLGFRLGKSPLCTLLRGNFPGAKFSLYRSISVSHLWNKCDQHISVIRTCFVCLFSFCFLQCIKIDNSKGYNNTI